MGKPNFIPDNSPAGRLWHILEAARQSDVHLTWEVWAEVLEMKKPQALAELQAYRCLYDLTGETEEQVRQLENFDAFASPVPLLNSFLKNMKMGLAWYETRKLLTEELMTALGLVAVVPSSYLDEGALADDQLTELVSETEELRASVVSSDLNEQLQQCIIDQLDGIRRALIDYRIHGRDSLRRTLERSIGAMMLNHDLFKQSPKDKHVLGLWGLLDKVNRLISTGGKLKKLAAPLVQFLLGGDAEPPSDQ